MTDDDERDREIARKAFDFGYEAGAYNARTGGEGDEMAEAFEDYWRTELAIRERDSTSK